MATVHIESLGSIWEIDALDMRYRRWPKHEAPRERPEWGDERAEALQDYTWHPMGALPVAVPLNGGCGPGVVGQLRIPIEFARRTRFGLYKSIFAPLFADEYARVEALWGEGVVDE